MLRVGSWLYGKKAASASTQSFDALSELQDLEDAMRSAILILNDDVDGAEAGLDRGTSSFHKTGKGIVAFVRATLGFEQDIMRQASERLGEAESSCASDQQRALHNQHAPHAYHSQIYTAGTEFALCQAAAQLMSAVVGVLNESLTEGLKGFYKMRKAFITLDGTLKMEEQFIRARSTTMLASAVESKLSSRQPRRVNLADQELKIKPVSQRAIEATIPSSGPQSGQTTQYATPLESPGLEQEVLDLTIADDLAEAPVPMDTSTPSTTSMLDHDPESEVFSNPLDVFVHSGANCCFGLLLLLISMVPPSFSRLLSIIGFRGDKRRGLRMLWQASKFHNLMGAIAALALLGYYNAFVRYCDIMPDVTSSEDKGIEGYPQERLTALLAEMRERFPSSQLWLLEHSRMNGANKNLRGALELLQTESKSPLKQVEALKMFEKSLNAMYLHEYQLCADCFVECVDLNSWSPTLYYYIAGCAQLALYRRTLQSDPSAASQYAKTATEYFQLAPTLAGKKRFMAKQLPFDVYVTRKMAKWESRAKEWKVSLVDAIGVDPFEEMIFFWNGHSRMAQHELEESLTNLAWCESDANTTSWSREGAEEKAILDVLRAAIYRSLHRHGEAKEILQTRVLNLDKSLFKGQLKDDWVLPVAHFEMAANLWMERPSYMASHDSPALSSQTNSDHTKADDAVDDDEVDEVVERAKVRECKLYLDKAAKWETFVLDTRLGLKVAAAVDAVQKWEDAHQASAV